MAAIIEPPAPMPAIPSQMMLHKRASSCTNNFDIMATNVDAFLRAGDWFNALNQIQTCFDDRYWYQRLPNYCGRWNDVNHFEQTRKILQLFYTLDEIRKTYTRANHLRLQHINAAPAPGIVNYGYFRIQNTVTGVSIIVKQDGASVNPAGPYVNKIVLAQEHSPFGTLPAMDAFLPPNMPRARFCDMRAGIPGVPRAWPVYRNRITPLAPPPPPAAAPPPPPPPPPPSALLPGSVTYEAAFPALGAKGGRRKRTRKARKMRKTRKGKTRSWK
jgi:hypothetical protein